MDIRMCGLRWTAVVAIGLYAGLAGCMTEPAAPAQSELREELQGPIKTICGNGVCEPGEDVVNCPDDCTCGNGVCDPGESTASCPQDCPAPVCGNGVCESGESAASCPADCGSPAPSCGNGVCEAGEDAHSCPQDCCQPGDNFCFVQ